MLESLLRPIRRGLVGLLFFGAIACGGAESYTPCSSDKDCSQGRICSAEGECVEQPDCGNGKCDAYLQENCATCPPDCGKCKELCDVCSTDTDCFDGKSDNRCITGFFDSIYYNGKGICGKECFSNNDCPKEYECKSFELSPGEKIKQCYSTHIFSDKPFSRIDKVIKGDTPTCLSTSPDDFSICEERGWGYNFSQWEELTYCQGSKLVGCISANTSVFSLDCSNFGLTCYSFGCSGKSNLTEPCQSDIDCIKFTPGGCYSKKPWSIEKVCMWDDCTSCPENYSCENDHCYYQY